MTKKNLTAEDYQEIDTLRNANKKAPRNATAGPSTNHDSPMELLIDPYLLTISTPSFDADDDVPCSGTFVIVLKTNTGILNTVLDETDPSRAMAPVAVENTPASATDTGASATSCDLTKAEGVVFPQRAETVDWADGHKTYLPWISDERDPSKNKLEKVCGFIQRHAATANPGKRKRATSAASRRPQGRRPSRPLSPIWNMGTIRPKSNSRNASTRK